MTLERIIKRKPSHTRVCIRAKVDGKWIGSATMIPGHPTRKWINTLLDKAEVELREVIAKHLTEKHKIVDMALQKSGTEVIDLGAKSA